MWHFISEQISENLGQDFICEDIRQVHQQFHTRSFRVTDGRQRYFIKVADAAALPRLECESQGLEHLRIEHNIKLPTVICAGRVSQYSFLVLEYLKMSEGSADLWFQFGRSLATLHGTNVQAQYGWDEDNFIGSTIQPNAWQKKWCHFFAEQRIGYLLQLLSEKNILTISVDNVVTSIKQLLAGHCPPASPLHGDLWQGNTGFWKNQPVIFDPAFYYGDRETDIAMTELFGRFPEPFYQGYQETWPLSQDYQYRKPVYQLYHLLNHALLFGGQYIQTAKLHLQHLDS